ncbi:MAG: hypothetical protein JNJ67_03460 [Chromatiales bacterium]|nr:hypothetical protein [Chromatiales bacterium]
MQKLKRGFGATGLTGLVLGLVVACGGGGGGGVAGIDRLGVTTGTINGFGSIIVNGVEYETNAADFDIDDGPGSQSELKVGQQVTIQWDSSDDGVTRNAQSVSYDDLLEGPIDSIDPGAQTLVILGQVVIVDAATSFDDEIVPRDLTGLELDDVVEVSGLIDANGVIRATRIDFSDSSDDFEVRGVVESLDTDDSTFIINGLTVDYFDVINPPALANGLFVEVEGDTFDAGILYAIRVEIEDDDISGADEGDDGELEGYITDFVSATNFSVSGVPVTTNGQTIYEHGVVGDLALNVKVEVEGELNSSGVLVARQVEFKSGDDDDDGDDDSIDGRVAGNVTAVNAGAGTLAIAGVAVTVTAETRFEDQTGAVGQFFGLDDISVGNYVEVRGDPGTGATLTAVILERDAADTEGLLRGPASAVNGVARSLSILGVPVTTDGGTVYRDDDDNAISATTFFAAISNGSEVEAQFTQGGGAIVADELELEDSDD